MTLSEENPIVFIELESIFQDQAKFIVKSVEVSEKSGCSAQVDDLGQVHRIRLDRFPSLNSGSVSIVRCKVEGMWGAEVVCVPCIVK